MGDEQEEKADEEKSLEEWMAQEQARLKEGFGYEPQPASEAGQPRAADEVLAGLGIGAGVVGGAVAPHANPVVLEGVEASLIAKALQKELPDEDTRVEVDRSGEAVVVSILKSQEDTPYQFSPALTATLIETEDTLTVTLSRLDKDAVREALTSMGGTVVEQGKRLLSGGGGLAGLLNAAGSLIEGAGEIAEEVQDLGLPKQVWEVIDRVGGVAEETYLEEQRKEQAVRRRREEAERAWTHCPSCGRAYREDEAPRVDCPSCGAVRGDKPDWLN